MHTEQLANLRKEADELGKKADAAKDAIAELSREIAVINQRLQEQGKKSEEWDRRFWGLMVVLVGALLSLAAGLIVTLVKR